MPRWSGTPCSARAAVTVAHAASLVGDPQVRHRGTIGGALAHADPAGDLPAVAVALDAELTAPGGGGERTISARELFLGPLTSALGADEVLTEVRSRELEGPGPDAVAVAAERAADGADPPGDTSATPELRSHLARVLVPRARAWALSRDTS